MENQKIQVVERLKQANNILVTVSNNPSVDQLAACIGLTLALNKAGKHATAVFSGSIPSTIEFLQPEKTLEKNTDSLQDFIIALDKSKADKLRYKVEDKVVKIFITPYRTSISQKDLDFSQGDFNVDVVVALGVHMQSDLDQAITSHGRILHDATVMSINIAPGSELGSVNWVEPSASSLSELGVQIVNALDQKLIDGQISTAFLTGIVAETDRFSNQRTSPQTMSISAQLMSSGANQQLVATKLEEPVVPPPAPVMDLNKDVRPSNNMPADSFGAPKPVNLPPIPPAPKPDDGTIEITHNDQPVNEPAPTEQPEEPQADEETQAPQIHIDDQGRLHPLDNLPPIPPAPPIIKREREDSSHMMTEPPTFEAPPMTANAVPEDEDNPTDPLGLPPVGLLNREPLPSQQSFPPAFDTPGATFAPNNQTVPPAPAPFSPVPTTLPNLGTPNPTFLPPTPAPNSNMWAGPMVTPPNASGPRTLSQIEEDVNSPHLDGTVAPSPPKDDGFVSPPNIVTPTTLPPAPPAAAPDTSVDDARNAVAQAINDSPVADDTLGPIKALNAQPLSGNIHANDQQIVNQEPAIVQPQQLAPMAPPPLTSLPGQPQAVAPTTGIPPTVPPPMMPMPPSFPLNS